MFLAKTANSQGFIDEVFDNVECVGCTATNGDFIAINTTPGLVVTGKDFILDAGGRVRGTVTDGTIPLPGITVRSTGRTARSRRARRPTASAPMSARAGSRPGTTWSGQKTARASSIAFTTASPALAAASRACPAPSSRCSRLRSGTGRRHCGGRGHLTEWRRLCPQPGGGISGTVTRTSDSSPLQGVFVQVYTEGGTFISSSRDQRSGEIPAQGVADR